MIVEIELSAKLWLWMLRHQLQNLSGEAHQAHTLFHHDPHRMKEILVTIESTLNDLASEAESIASGLSGSISATVSTEVSTALNAQEATLTPVVTRLSSALSTIGSETSLSSSTGSATGTGTGGSIAALSLTPAAGSLANPALSTAYSATLAGAGGTSPYTYAVSAGALPDGLSLDSTGGTLTGTPGTAGDFNFTVMVTDAAGATASQDYTVSVS